ncbi:MAG: hypothetical protein MSA15_20405 [Clostridium sp.]|nr:hypothetical protein [Clostridium sp.]
MKYENKIWKLTNVNKLPKDKRGYISYQNCVGFILKYEYKPLGLIYDIKILDCIKENKDGHKIVGKFKLSYTFLEGTDYEEEIIRIKQCESMIHGVRIGDIIPSLNQWKKEEDYWIGISSNGKEFKFNTNNKETEYKILHMTWCFDNNGYVSSSKWRIHRFLYYNGDKNEATNNNYIDHINNCKEDNRIDNLRSTSPKENNKNKNTNNKYGLVGLTQTKNKSWYSHFMYQKWIICTKRKKEKLEAELDNLIAQKYLGFRHNEDQFYKIKGLSEERIKEVTDLLDKKIENNKNKIKKEKEYSYDYIEKDNLIGIRTFKKDGTENPICWVDRDFGKIKKDEYVINGTIVYRKDGYFVININNIYRINNYVLMEENGLQNYKGYNFHVDHINNRPNENYRDNLEIVTIQSNMMNKKGKGYYEEKQKNRIKYKVGMFSKWRYFDLYIGGLKQPAFDIEKEAIVEVKRRKEIVNKYRFRIGWQGSVEANMKVLDEVINFADEHDLDIDSAYIVWKGLDSLENIKNFLKTIDE